MNGVKEGSASVTGTGATSHERFDVIVVGFGLAGASAAIEAADAGAEVLVLDKAYGGGASAISGGVVYAGGGTRYQREAGFEDSPENMFDYLKQEVEGAVSDARLREFCETSVERVDWLEEQGAAFDSSLCEYKTSYPTDDHYLYFSGNEKSWPYTNHADPAPRGHRQVAQGLNSGATLFEAVKASALERNVTFRPLSRVDSLLHDENGVQGVEYRQMDPARSHRYLTTAGRKLTNWLPPVGKLLMNRTESMFERRAETKTAQAPAVILAAGGFQFNRSMVEAFGDPYMDTNPLGTGDSDGSGIQLGTNLGAQLGQMHRMSAWRFLSPPEAFMEGVAVGFNGERITNEDLYGATFSKHLIGEHDGNGFLILDSTSWERAKRQRKTQTQSFQRAQLLYVFSRFGHERYDSLRELATETPLDTKRVRETIGAYNDGVANGRDPAHKKLGLCVPIENPPFYAVDISVDVSNLFPVPSLTLGGLITDDETAGVQNARGQPIPGLHAAGRNAVGVCSNNYVSGLSLADCVFSGRKAGEAAANRSTT